jgi:ABC-type multidrug transport system ATPase subunit
VTSSGPDILLQAGGFRPIRESTMDGAVAVMGGSVLAILSDEPGFPKRLAAMLAGLEKPWCGSITVGKRGIPVADKAARRIIGFVRSAPAGPGDMTPMQILDMVASASGLGVRKGRTAARETLEWCGLSSSSSTRLTGLPPESAFPVSFAAALMHNPAVIVIEPRVPEPFFPHLDALKEAGRAIVATGSGLAALPPCTDRVALCSDTDLVRTIGRTELLEYTARASEISISFCPSITRNLVEEMPGIESLRVHETGFRLRHRSPLSAVTWLVNLARANSRTIASLEIRPPGISTLIDMIQPAGIQTLFSDSEEE